MDLGVDFTQILYIFMHGKAIIRQPDAVFPANLLHAKALKRRHRFCAKSGLSYNISAGSIYGLRVDYESKNCTDVADNLWTKSHNSITSCGTFSINSNSNLYVSI